MDNVTVEGWSVGIIILVSLVVTIFSFILAISPLLCWVHIAHMRGEIKKRFREMDPVLIDTNRTLKELLAFLKSDEESNIEVKQYVCDKLDTIAGSLEKTGNTRM